MKRISALLLVTLALFSCAKSEVVLFWSTHSIDYTDIDAAENQFADFAELAVAAPEPEALKAIDVLFNSLKKDEVAYYIYTDWMEGAFYNILSPCRSAALYGKCVNRIVKDGIIPQGAQTPYLQKREWIEYNLPGSVATVPGVSINERTVVLVLDQGCPSCREALSILSDKWADLRRVAVCCGYGPVPDFPGWEYVEDRSAAAAVFDPRMTPLYFVVAPDGKVEVPYTLVF